MDSAHNQHTSNKTMEKATRYNYSKELRHANKAEKRTKGEKGEKNKNSLAKNITKLQSLRLYASFTIEGDHACTPV